MALERLETYDQIVPPGNSISPLMDEEAVRFLRELELTTSTVPPEFGLCVLVGEDQSDTTPDITHSNGNYARLDGNTWAEVRVGDTVYTRQGDRILASRNGSQATFAGEITVDQATGAITVSDRTAGVTTEYRQDGSRTERHSLPGGTQGGREWAITFDCNGHIAQVINARGQRADFTWDGDRLVGMSDSRGTYSRGEGNNWYRSPRSPQNSSQPDWVGTIEVTPAGVITERSERTGRGISWNADGSASYLDASGQVVRTREIDGSEVVFHTNDRGERVGVRDSRITQFNQPLDIPEYRQEQLRRLAQEMANRRSTPFAEHPNAGRVVNDTNDPNWSDCRVMTFAGYGQFLRDLADDRGLTNQERSFILGEVTSELTRSQQYRESREESCLILSLRNGQPVESSGRFVMSTEDANPFTLREGHPNWSRHHIVDWRTDGYSGRQVFWAPDIDSAREAVRLHEVEHKERGNLLRVATGVALLWTFPNLAGNAESVIRRGGLDQGSTLATLYIGQMGQAFQRHQGLDQFGALANSYNELMVNPPARR